MPSSRSSRRAYGIARSQRGGSYAGSWVQERFDSLCGPVTVARDGVLTTEKSATAKDCPRRSFKKRKKSHK